MKKTLLTGLVVASVALLAACTTLQSASAQQVHKEEAQGYIHEAPNFASEPWILAAGGRIYDMWWEAP